MEKTVVKIYIKEFAISFCLEAVTMNQIVKIIILKPKMKSLFVSIIKLANVNMIKSVLIITLKYALIF